jgi:Galactose oxidase, central domain/Kelch motif
MTNSRSGQTATLLANGTVLIVGCAFYGSLQAEIYTPSTGEFTLTGSLNTNRCGHTATLLYSGEVLIAGGSSDTSAELYNPSTGDFTYTGNMTAIRNSDTATFLEDGTVLFAGGSDSQSILSSAEIYNPTTGTFAITGSMSTPRIGHAAGLLPNGMALITGGDSASGSLASAEVYNAPTKSFTLTGNMTTQRVRHSETVLSNGKVLIAGGTNSALGVTGSLGSAELYSETAFGSLDDTLTGWQKPPCSNANPYGSQCAGGNGTPSSTTQTKGNASPSIDGSSMEISLTYPSGTQGSGTVTTSGTAVTWVSGTQFSTNWIYLTMTVNGTKYVIKSVTSGTKLTLSTSAGAHTTAVSYTVYLPQGETINVLWPYKAGVQDSLTHMIGTFSVYMPSLSNIQALEYDQFQFDNGQRYMYGSQCVFGSGGKWWIWNQCANSNGGKWVVTTISCSLTAAAWHTLQWQTHRVAGDTSCTGGNPCMYYDALVIDGTTYSGSSYGLTPQCSAPNSEPDNAGIQFQIDESYLGGTASEYLDLVSLTLY